MKPRNPLDVAIWLPSADDPALRCEHSDPAQGERALWVAVLDGVLSDALHSYGAIRSDARRWWGRRVNRWRDWILASLGYEPEVVIAAVRRRIAEAVREEDRVYDAARRNRESLVLTAT